MTWRRRYQFALAVALTSAALGSGLALAASPASPFCPDGVGEAPCATMPADVSGVDIARPHLAPSAETQAPLDRFAWQTFIALNWPATDTGDPIDAGLGTRPSAPRVWQAFATADEVVGDNAKTDTVCPPRKGGAVTLTTRHYHQASGHVLIDRALNYIVYDTRLNASYARYVRAHGLETASGQQAFAAGQRRVAFPVGRGSDGALSLKTSWRILAEADNFGRYATVPGRIAVTAEDSLDGTARCLSVTLGLVGLHIARRTRGANGDSWIWATFEHADTAPYAADAPRADALPPRAGLCRRPELAALDQEFLLYQAGCPNCLVNDLEPEYWQWAAEPPHARQHAQTKRYGSQILRCWRPHSVTERINTAWRDKLTGTPWAHYRLMGTQWRANTGGGPFGHGEIPRFLANASMESYVQDPRFGSCLGCHQSAETVAEQSADFSFVLRRAR